MEQKESALYRLTRMDTVDWVNSEAGRKLGSVAHGIIVAKPKVGQRSLDSHGKRG